MGQKGARVHGPGRAPGRRGACPRSVGAQREARGALRAAAICPERDMARQDRGEGEFWRIAQEVASPEQRERAEDDDYSRLGRLK